MQSVKHSGFTLIELVIVIVILGILAAAALPRFSDLSTDARFAALNGLAGGIRSAALLAHSTQLAKNLSPAQTITMEGVAIAMSAGYPVAAGLSGISRALADFSGFTVVPFAVGTSAEAVDFRLNNRVDCSVRYTASNASQTGGAGFTVVLTSTGGDGC